MSLLAELKRVLGGSFEEAVQLAAIEAIRPELAEADRSVIAIAEFMGVVRGAASPAVNALMIKKFAPCFLHNLDNLNFALSSSSEDNQYALLQVFNQNKIEKFDDFIRILGLLGPRSRFLFLQLLGEVKLQSLIVGVNNLLEFSTFVERDKVVDVLGLDFIHSLLSESTKLKKELVELPPVIARLKENLELVKGLTLLEQELRVSMLSIGDATDATDAAEQLEKITALKSQALERMADECRVEPAGFDEKELVAHLSAVELRLKHALYHHAHPLEDLDHLAQTLAETSGRKETLERGVLPRGAATPAARRAPINPHVVRLQCARLRQEIDRLSRGIPRLEADLQQATIAAEFQAHKAIFDKSVERMRDLDASGQILQDSIKQRHGVVCKIQDLDQEVARLQADFQRASTVFADFKKFKAQFDSSVKRIWEIDSALRDTPSQSDLGLQGDSEVSLDPEFVQALQAGRLSVEKARDSANDSILELKRVTGREDLAELESDAALLGVKLQAQLESLELLRRELVPIADLEADIATLRAQYSLLEEQKRLATQAMNALREKAGLGELLEVQIDQKDLEGPLSARRLKLVQLQKELAQAEHELQHFEQELERSIGALALSAAPNSYSMPHSEHSAASIKRELLETISFFYEKLIDASYSFEDISLDRVALVGILESLSNDVHCADFLRRLSDKKLIELIPNINALRLVPAGIRGVVFDRVQGFIDLTKESDKFLRSLNDLESVEKWNRLIPGILNLLVDTEAKLFSLLKKLDEVGQFAVLQAAFSPEHLARLLKENLSLDKDSFKAKVAELDPSIRRSALAAMAMAYGHERSSVGRQYLSAGGRLFGFASHHKLPAAAGIVGMLQPNATSTVEFAPVIARAFTTGRLAKIYEAACDVLSASARTAADDVAAAVVRPS